TLVGSTLYGTTEDGGSQSEGTIFSIQTDGTGFQTLHSFSGTDGNNPSASLTLGGATLYSTTRGGGSDFDGTIYSIHTDGTDFQTLYSFSGTDGAYPTANLTPAGSTLYGTTQQGGNNNDGTIFSISTDGTGFQTLYTFSGNDGFYPAAGLTLAGSTLYGTADDGGNNYDGTIFSIGTNGAGFQMLYSFSLVNGADPIAGLTLAGSTLYGTTSQGGIGAGTLFALSGLALTDLTVTNSAAASVVAGQNLTYSITVSNTGSVDAQSVSLDDLLPSGETLISQTQASGPNFTLAASGNQVSDTIATLSVGDTATFTIVVSISGSLSGGTQLANTATLSDGLGDQAISTATTNVLYAVPQVIGVLASGSQWKSAFTQYLDGQGLGLADDQLGYELGSGSNQLDTLPWSNIDTLRVEFNTDVNIVSSDLTLVGSSDGPSAPSVTGFSYDSTTHVATWVLSGSLPADKYLLNLDASAITATNNGLALDGDWATSTTRFSIGSGDGTPGGDFNFTFYVVPGDENNSAGTTNGDLLFEKSAVGSNTTVDGYNYREDTDGSGSITNSDVLLTKLQVGNAISFFADPVAQPSPAVQTPAASVPEVLGATVEKAEAELNSVNVASGTVASPGVVSSSVATPDGTASVAADAQSVLALPAMATSVALVPVAIDSIAVAVDAASLAPSPAADPASNLAVAVVAINAQGAAPMSVGVASLPSTADVADLGSMVVDSAPTSNAAPAPTVVVASTKATASAPAASPANPADVVFDLLADDSQSQEPDGTGTLADLGSFVTSGGGAAASPSPFATTVPALQSSSPGNRASLATAAHDRVWSTTAGHHVFLRGPRMRLSTLGTRDV
ncbi:MAG TPA: choice-of-anchor tandem repeat GloVer-containing protein, partial [Pirellulales bacterium]